MIKQSSRYCRIEPNSQFFTDLDQILNYLKVKSKDDYLKIGIQNTIDKGYKLKLPILKRKNKWKLK